MASPANAKSPVNGCTSIPPSAMPLISPSALLHAHLFQTPSRRPSGRLPTECRQISLNTSSLTHANGSALIRIGDTAVVCGIRAEILPIHEIANYRVKRIEDASSRSEATEDEASYLEVTSNNLLVPNIELSTGCSPNHLPGVPPSVEAQSISQRLLSLLHSCRIVRPSDLKIHYTTPPDMDLGEEGTQLKAYWTLYIDILCISYGGSIFDAAWMALYAALNDTLLPASWWDANLGQVLCSPELAQAKKLTLRRCPVPLTFGVFVPEQRTAKQVGQEMWVLCDTDSFEEECCAETGCVVVNVDKGKSLEVVRLEKSGGGRIGLPEIKRLLIIAEKRSMQWDQILKAG